MKRYIAFALVLCLLLCGCGKQDETTPSTTEATTESTAETVETTTGTTEETDSVCRHPLNGEILDTPYTGRATAVVINNLIDCLPQYGIGDADIVYEVVTEGGITRLLAIFPDLEGVGSIGPVRSSRTFFNNISQAYDAPIIHCGGSWGGINGHMDDAGTTVSGWHHINEQNNGSYFFRDKDRYNYQNYSWEHTLFTNGELLQKGLENLDYAITHDTPVDFGLQFQEEIDLDGETANTVTVNFKGGKTTTMTYQADTGLYKASQYKRDHVDAGTGEVQSYRNVLILYTEQWGISDSQYLRSFYTLVGSGEGQFACNGEIIPILWERSSLEEPFRYTLKDGTPLTLGVGKTYVAIAANTVSAEYQ